MKDLLFLSHRIPFPPDKGEKIRAWHMLRRLARTHRVHLGCFIDDPRDLAHVAELQSYCADLCCVTLDPRLGRLRALRGLLHGCALSLGYFDDRRLRRWVEEKLATGIDRVFVYCSAMAPYVMDAPVHRVLDMVDVDSEKWAAYARDTRGPARLIWSREARTLLALERQAAGAFDHTLLVTPAEVACFAALAPDCGGRVGAMANGVDLDHFTPDTNWPNPYPADLQPLVFTGTMDYAPNVDAVVWFAEQVMPILRGGPHRAVFTIVGANPTAAVRRLASPDVMVTGRVADTRPYLAHAALAVAPLRIARGIQNKVLEAMAMGRPVVASPQAHEGVDAVAGRDLLVAADAPAMAARIAEVLSGAYPAMSAAARLAMERGHDWEATLAGLPGLFETVGETPAVPVVALEPVG